MKAEFLSYFLENYYYRATVIDIAGFLDKIEDINDPSRTTQDQRKLVETFISELDNQFLQNPEDKFLNYTGLDKESDTYRYLSKDIVASLTTALSDHGISDTFYAICRSLKRNVNHAKKNLSSGYMALRSVGAYDKNLEKIDQPVIQVTLPQHFRNADLESVGSELQNQAKILKLLNDAFYGTREDIETLALASSDLSTFIKSNYQYATHLSAVIYFVLSTANGFMDYRIKQMNLAKLTGKAFDDKLLDDVRETVGKQCAEEISKKFFIGDGEGLNFSLEKCSAGAVKLFDSILDGTTYDIQIPKLHTPEKVNFSAELLESLMKESILIRQEFETLPRVDYTQKITHEGDE